MLVFVSIFLTVFVSLSWVHIQMGWDRLNNNAIGHISCQKHFLKYFFSIFFTFTTKRHFLFCHFCWKASFIPTRVTDIITILPTVTLTIHLRCFLCNEFSNPPHKAFFAVDKVATVKNVWHSDPITEAHPKLGGNAFQIPERRLFGWTIHKIGSDDE